MAPTSLSPNCVGIWLKFADGRRGPLCALFAPCTTQGLGYWSGATGGHKEKRWSLKVIFHGFSKDGSASRLTRPLLAPRRRQQLPARMDA